MDPRSCLLLLLIFHVSTEPVSAECGVLDKPCGVEVAEVCKECTNAGQKVPDPLDCHSYYVCEDDGTLMFTVPFDCPDGKIFNSSKDVLDCVPGSTCEPLCNSPGGGGACLYTCAGGGGGDPVLADPYDCRVYYECSGGNPGMEQQCHSEAPFFDGASCQEDESLCCHCQPYCYDGDSVVGDPKDCRKYYGCSGEGPPNVDYSGQCDDGEHFDSHLLTCSSSTPCITLCKNVVGGDGCIDPFTCEEKGYFAKCPYKCVPEYFHCTEVSDTYAVPDSCPNGLVFHPDNLVCIQNSTCPYN